MNTLNKISPGAWLLSGFWAFPMLCYASQMVTRFILDSSGIYNGHRMPEFGWGGIIGMSGVFLGVPLGILSAFVVDGWRNGRVIKPRVIAGIGGLLIGSGWFRLLLLCDPFVWIGEFGVVMPPLLWAAGLILFAVAAKPRTSSP